jgi:hypothetical protein
MSCTPSFVKRSMSVPSRIIICALAVLVWSAVWPAPAQADLTYTWHEDDNQKVTGSIVVPSSALANGEFTWNNITSFSWVDPEASFTTSDVFLAGLTITIPISSTTGAFTSTDPPNTGFLDAFNSADTLGVTVYVDAASMSTMGGYWYDPFYYGTTVQGYGHWTVSNSSAPPPTAPEPSTLFIALFAIACVCVKPLIGSGRNWFDSYTAKAVQPKTTP